MSRAFLNFESLPLPVPVAIGVLLICFPLAGAFSQNNFPHAEAHAHNDYQHDRPLLDALGYGFMSVEADVHLHNGKLIVAHDRVEAGSPDLETSYLASLDSIVRRNKGRVYPGYAGRFYLMIDIKTDAEPAFRLLQDVLKSYPSLDCKPGACPVQLFLSGNRPVEMIIRDGYGGIGLDGRPEDLGKGYSPELMPVVSDRYGNWSSWDGKPAPGPHDLDRIRELADRVHAEGKKLRLWAIPDNNLAWEALLASGVDLINTDRLEELHRYLGK